MRIAVIGVGLIGGSVALAAREQAGAHVSGHDRDPEVLEHALGLGLLDRACATVAEALEEADAAFVAVPVGALPAAVAAVLEAAPPDCVVTDVGSVKRALVASVDDRRFVGGHPLAGTEHSGASHARADLFDGATWYLTPTGVSSPELYESLCELLTSLGARPEAIDAHDHDRLMATVSHLPHVLANVLVAQASAVGVVPGATAPSFRDAIRVAGAPSTIWTDIYLQNADLLCLAIERTVGGLEEFRDALADADAGRIRQLNEAAAAARRELLS